MKKSLAAALSGLLCMALAGGGTAYGQQSRTYKESFKVDPEVAVRLNTSHADIEFETWNRNEVVVEAVITLKGASEEEARAYFEAGGVKILGNSSEVEISTGAEPGWAFRFNAPEIEHLELNIPDIEIPEIAPILAEMDIAAMVPPMPPMPPMPSFDYEAYEKDGEAYMKRWQEEYKQSFTPELEARMKEWSERMEERGEELSKRMEERTAEMQERMAARQEEMQRRSEERAAAMEERMEAREHAREEAAKAREMARKAREDVERSRVFFMRGAEGNRNFSIEKTIRIKMPKNARLKLNVRHGEVKLAENARNVQATLSYARLLAASIVGDQTDVSVRYSPVDVKAWNGGRLHADFSEAVQLDLVETLQLSATSSEVTIDRLTRELSIRNNLGALRIGAIAPEFSRLEVNVQNGSLDCLLPDAPYRISLSENASSVTYPARVVWNTGQGSKGGSRKGYFGRQDAQPSIVINASYSDVKLRE